MDTFSAVSHPTRRAILDLLVSGEQPAGGLVTAFPAISQPAVSRHLRVLRNSELVDSRVQAQQRIYNLKPKALAKLDAWTAKYQAFWPERLDALEEHLFKEEQRRRRDNIKP
jgi:DNA-binding transcriptional ArsR family regulator